MRCVRRKCCLSLMVWMCVLLPFFMGCEPETLLPDQATSGPEIHPDIPVERIIREPATNDPRGLYAANNPLFVVFAPGEPGVSITEVPIEKKGSGTVRFDGDNPNFGTYIADDWFLSVRTSITFTEDGQSVTFPIDASGVFIAGRGTWEVYDEGLMVLDGRDSIDYAVDDRGMYLFRTVPYFRLNGDFPPIEVDVIKVLKK